jgi:hypothetical protein
MMLSVVVYKKEPFGCMATREWSKIAEYWVLHQAKTVRALGFWGVDKELYHTGISCGLMECALKSGGT